MSLFSAVLYKSDDPAAIFMAEEKIPNFNSVPVSKSQFFKVVSGKISVLQKFFLASLLPCYELEKIEVRSFLMTLAQAHSFNNQVGWNVDLLPGTTELFQTTPGESLFITNILHNIIFFFPLSH